MRIVYLFFFFLIGHLATGQALEFDFKVNKERRRMVQLLDLNKEQAQRVEDILTKSKKMAQEALALSENVGVEEFLKGVAFYFDMHEAIDRLLDESQREKHKNLIIPKDVFLKNYLDSAQGLQLNKKEMSQLLSAWKLL
jgi:hypothetical protein